MVTMLVLVRNGSLVNDQTYAIGFCMYFIYSNVWLELTMRCSVNVLTVISKVSLREYRNL